MNIQILKIIHSPRYSYLWSCTRLQTVPSKLKTTRITEVWRCFLCPFEVPAIEGGKNNQLKVIVDVTQKWLSKNDEILKSVILSFKILALVLPFCMTQKLSHFLCNFKRVISHFAPWREISVLTALINHNYGKTSTKSGYNCNIGILITLSKTKAYLANHSLNYAAETASVSWHIILERMHFQNVYFQGSDLKRVRWCWSCLHRRKWNKVNVCIVPQNLFSWSCSGLIWCGWGSKLLRSCCLILPRSATCLRWYGCVLGEESEGLLFRSPLGVGSGVAFSFQCT